jgi:hypothetical protein
MEPTPTAATPTTTERKLGKIVSLGTPASPPIIAAPGIKPSRYVFFLEHCKGTPEVGCVVSFLPGQPKRGKCGRASGVEVALTAAEVSQIESA